jgi:hypothetical protein
MSLPEDKEANKKRLNIQVSSLIWCVEWNMVGRVLAREKGMCKIMLPSVSKMKYRMVPFCMPVTVHMGILRSRMPIGSMHSIGPITVQAATRTNCTTCARLGNGNTSTLYVPAEGMGTMPVHIITLTELSSGRCSEFSPGTSGCVIVSL